MTTNTAREPGRRRPPKSAWPHHSPKSKAGWVMNRQFPGWRLRWIATQQLQQWSGGRGRFRDSGQASHCIPRWKTVSFPSVSCFLGLSKKRTNIFSVLRGSAPHMHTVGLQAVVLKSDFLALNSLPCNPCYLGCLGEIAKSLWAPAQFPRMLSWHTVNRKTSYSVV